MHYGYLLGYQIHCTWEMSEVPDHCRVAFQIKKEGEMNIFADFFQ
jgi:hypothetical protein